MFDSSQKPKINIKQLAWFDAIFLIGVLWAVLNFTLAKRISNEGISANLKLMAQSLQHWKWAVFILASLIVFGLSKLLERMIKDEYVLEIVRVGIVELPLGIGFCLSLWLKNMDCFCWLAAVTLVGLAINFPRLGKN